MNRLFTTICRAGWAASLAVLASLTFAGCDDSIAAPVAANPDTARSTLQQALEAWQGGKSISAAKESTPSIIAADPLWEKGQKLTKFEIVGPGKLAGAEQVFAVNLWVVDVDGSESRQSVEYKVGTEPVLTVFRALF